LNKNNHSMKKLSRSKNSSGQAIGLNRSVRFGKPVRPVLLGQSGRTQPARKTQHTKRSISQFVPRIKVRLWGLPLARGSVPKTHSIKRNRKSTLENTFHGNH
jgi:hypothetical protein